MAAGNFHKGSAACPACGKALAPKHINEHTSACAAWLAAHGKPWPKFKYDAWAADRKPLFEEGTVEGVDYLRCRVCAEHGWDFRFSLLTQHIKVHELTEAAYVAKYPGAAVRLGKTEAKRQATTQATYGVANISQSQVARDSTRQTSLEKYGVEHAAQAPEAIMRRAQTNRERYGVENPFAAGSVQEKIRQTHIRERGVENPGQDPEVQAKRSATNQERYGVDHYLQTQEFQEQFKATSRRNYGTDHPMKSEAGMALWMDGNQKAFGCDSGFSHPDIAKKAYETNLANHGGKHSQQCPEVLEKARATCIEKYGVDNPAKTEEVKSRIKDVWTAKYGVPFPPQSLWINREVQFPTGPERAVIGLAPDCVVYAGDGAYWVRCRGESRSRNPDFVVLSRQQCEQYRAGAKLNDLRTHSVIEVFGDYWHGPSQTGKSREVHKLEVVEFYLRAGLRCLVLWEQEIKHHPKQVAERIQRYLGMNVEAGV